jgi:hypothetical protein
MIEWDKITDEEMRKVVVDRLMSGRDEMARQAERSERRASEPGAFYKARKEDEACAAYSRRQAGHYQQALDLLTAALMPAKEEM